MNDNTESQLKREIQIIKRPNIPTTNVNYNYLFKISLIGDSGVGKTSILLRFVDNSFKDDTSSTIGVDFKIVSVYLGDDIYAKMQLWDTCGSERFKSLTSSFIKSCPAFLLIFDLTKHKSFKNIENWISIINENTNPKLTCLIGNKCDMPQRQVTREEAIEFSQKYNLNYIETSAKTNENIEEVFLQVATFLHSEVNKKKSENDKSGLSSFEIGGYKNISRDEVKLSNPPNGGGSNNTSSFCTCKN